MNKELLSPAGSMETLKLAINNGCDAVYLGGKLFNARKYATNFNNDELINAIKYAHLFGVKVYVTVNTIIFENEIIDFIDYIKFLYKIGVDALIMQDLGMIYLVRKIVPDFEIHVSTQAFIHNIEQIKFYENLGVKRVVVARELSLSEINSFNTNLELEVFIHGALCVCYSGECLFSKLIFDRSANRGECAGVCRLPFSLIKDNKEIIKDKYLLSMKELNTLDNFKNLLNSNIKSFKIEGRMKSSATISYITRLYRKIIDNYSNNITDLEKDNLLSLYNRKFTSGYLFNNNYKDVINIDSSNHLGLYIGDVISVNSKKIKIKLNKELNQGDGIRFKNSNLGMNANYIYDLDDKLINKGDVNSIIYLDNKIDLKENDLVYKTIDTKLIKEIEKTPLKKIPIIINANVLNNYLYLEISDLKNTVSDKFNIVEESKNTETNKERLEEQLSKLGNTPFILKNININDYNNKFIPISKINDARRLLIDKLINIREISNRDLVSNNIFNPIYLNDSSNIKINVLVRNKTQLLTVLKYDIDKIYVTDYDLYNEYKDNNKIYLRLDRVIDNYKDLHNERILVSEVGSINKYKDSIVDIDYYSNIVNSYNIDFLRKYNNVNDICLSLESNFDNTKDLIKKCGNKNISVLLYSRVEVMISKYLLFNDKSNYMLKDRNSNSYPLLVENNLMHIFNYKVNILKDYLKYKDIGIKNYRIEFFDEDVNEIKKVLEKYIKELK